MLFPIRYNILSSSTVTRMQAISDASDSWLSRFLSLQTGTRDHNREQSNKSHADQLFPTFDVPLGSILTWGLSLVDPLELKHPLPRHFSRYADQSSIVARKSGGPQKNKGKAFLRFGVPWHLMDKSCMLVSAPLRLHLFQSRAPNFWNIAALIS